MLGRADPGWIGWMIRRSRPPDQREQSETGMPVRTQSAASAPGGPACGHRAQPKPLHRRLTTRRSSAPPDPTRGGRCAVQTRRERFPNPQHRIEGTVRRTTTRTPRYHPLPWPRGVVAQCFAISLSGFFSTHSARGTHEAVRDACVCESRLGGPEHTHTLECDLRVLCVKVAKHRATTPLGGGGDGTPGGGQDGPTRENEPSHP